MFVEGTPAERAHETGDDDQETEVASGKSCRENPGAMRSARPLRASSGLVSSGVDISGCPSKDYKVGGVQFATECKHTLQYFCIYYWGERDTRSSTSSCGQDWPTIAIRWLLQLTAKPQVEYNDRRQ